MACAITPVRPSSGLRRPVPSFANATPQLGLTLPNSARIASCYFTQSSNSCRQVRCSSAAASASAAWPEASGPAERSALETVFAQVRAVLFYAVTFAVSVPLFMVMLAVFPLVVALDKRKRRAEHAVNRLWAQMSTWLFYRVEIEGRENLPSNDTASVYVANHESFLDIFTLFHLGRDFKFVSKVSNFIIPVIGWSMFLTGHVMLNRADIEGFRRFLEVGRSLLRAGASLLIFPEGTRTVDGRLQPFKKGAFSIAKMSKVQVVPISLVGTGALMPNKGETKLFPGSCKIVVHPPIDTRGKKTEEVAELCQKAIASRLPAWKLQPAL